MCMAYKNNLTDKRVYDNKMWQSKTRWLHTTGERPTTLDDTLDYTNPTLYRNINTILTILLMMPCRLTATLQRSFSTMCRAKTYLRVTMKTERLSALALMHTYKDNDWRGGRGSWVLQQEEQAGCWTLDSQNLEIFSWAFSPEQSIITSNWIALGCWEFMTWEYFIIKCFVIGISHPEL